MVVVEMEVVAEMVEKVVEATSASMASVLTTSSKHGASLLSKLNLRNPISEFKQIQFLHRNKSRPAPKEIPDPRDVAVKEHLGVLVGRRDHLHFFLKYFFVFPWIF